ncbi:MAG: GNAT family N-acetyltransferase [Gammaproteobacteria bacterium]|nr:GNAT family N-acetyltransferase [Gammaproteobacteria bacterium]
MSADKIIIRDADWLQDNSDLKYIRREVFIVEQQVPEAMEWDEQDLSALHCLAIVNNKAVATARLQRNGQLGRMAVLKEYRHRGIGGMLLTHLINKYPLPISTPLFLHAQKHAVDFYKKYHFIRDENEFMEAGIPHYLMTMRNDK